MRDLIAIIEGLKIRTITITEGLKVKLIIIKQYFVNMGEMSKDNKKLFNRRLI